jgi:Co/Zn/Cd efflux system component
VNGPEVGRWHNKSAGFFGSTAHAAYLQIAGDAVQDVEDIVATLVYVWIKKKEEDDATQTSIIASSAGA